MRGACAFAEQCRLLSEKECGSSMVPRVFHDGTGRYGPPSRAHAVPDGAAWINPQLRQEKRSAGSGGQVAGSGGKACRGAGHIFPASPFEFAAVHEPPAPLRFQDFLPVSDCRSSSSYFHTTDGAGRRDAQNTANRQQAAVPLLQFAGRGAALENHATTGPAFPSASRPWGRVKSSAGPMGTMRVGLMSS